MTEAAVEVREMLLDAEVSATFGVMSQLRPHLREDEYPRMVGRMRGNGYRLAAVIDDGCVTCVAGFRVHEFLYCGRHLYVDDLVTDGGRRSRGHGKTMLDWLLNEAREAGCEQLHLDSGVQRREAHRFYFREGMAISSFHFSKVL